jgi:L-alanine-DL-glutamate epimerase-like enolase superfamily enzyme
MLSKMGIAMADLQNKIPGHRHEKRLRKHTDAIFRIDANWLGVEETIKNAISLKKLGVEFLEQPG